MEPRIVATGLEFPEGPVALANGDVIVTEIAAGRLSRVKRDGSVELLAVTGGGPNGAALGPDGALYVTQNGGFQWRRRPLPDGSTGIFPGEQPEDYRGGAIQRVTLGGEVSTLYTECNGIPLKGPNDLVFDREGNFYFTDLGKNRAREKDRTGVYYASPDGRFIREIIFPMEGPNGIGLSPDERTLYVAETPTGRLWAYDVQAPGQVANGRVIGTVPGAPPFGYAFCDSMAVDAEGNVIVATILNGGLTIFSPDGGQVRHVPCPDRLTTNACFGPDMGSLYVTLSSTGRLGVFDAWPTTGLRLNFAA